MVSACGRLLISSSFRTNPEKITELNMYIVLHTITKNQTKQHLRILDTNPEKTKQTLLLILDTNPKKKTKQNMNVYEPRGSGTLTLP